METLAQFYIIYPLGLSDLGLMELKEKWNIHYPAQKLEILSEDEGGVLINVTTLQGFSLNHILRSPTRILLRVAEFKARDFPKLFNKISKLPMKHLLIGQRPEVEASATNSKLFDSRKIEKAITDGIEESYRKQPVKKKYLDHFEANKTNDLPKLYYRAVDDMITISIDTTGELLHKRGDKLFTGLAPIRESLASILLAALTHDLDKKPYTLIDPMSGSGTFLIEAHDSYKINNDRPFAYQHFPLWIDYALKKQFIDKFKSAENEKFSKYLGFEINEEVLKLAIKNTVGKNIQIKKGDIFAKSEVLPGDNLIVINPPYGLRVGEKSDINVEYYKKIIQSVREKYNPVRLGIIIPDEHRFNPAPKDLVARIPFKNGGLPVIFYILKN
ncbi:MAG: N-6 DNA methylase [Rhizobacter sp.]|nr:N-6 DNA methylase [Bacteriovorax sp.]